MAEVISAKRFNDWKLILVPSLISLVVTLLRLTGELEHWSDKWFSTETGGIIPSGVSWVFGITWLALPFGIYFALKLSADGQFPQHLGRAGLCAVLGLIIGWGGLRFIPPLVRIGFPRILIVIWLIMVVAAGIQLPGWRALFRTLFAYGLASRIPVVFVMFFAMHGDWGTHYDYVGMPPQFQMSFVREFFWLAFFPQLVFWVAFTILIGSVGGIIAVAIVHRGGPAPQAGTMVP